MPTTMSRFNKQIGNVHVTIAEETTHGEVSRKITLTSRRPDGSEVPTFSDEGDLAQLGMALWRAQEWLNAHQEHQPAIADAAGEQTPPKLSRLGTIVPSRDLSWSLCHDAKVAGIAAYDWRECLAGNSCLRLLALLWPCPHCPPITCRNRSSRLIALSKPRTKP